MPANPIVLAAMLSLLSFLSVGALVAQEPAKPEAAKPQPAKSAAAKPEPAKSAVTKPAAGKPTPKAAVEPAEADGDFAYQGEYAGQFRVGRSGYLACGLQVVALGGGKFEGAVLRGGLPGAGWDGSPRIKLAGSLAEGAARLTLAGEGFEARVEPSFAELDGLDGWKELSLEKVDRGSPTLGLAPPANAVRLFDGSDTGELSNLKISPSGLMEVGAITKRKFTDFRLHLEFRTPYMPAARGQGRGNSGVYIQQRYEVQILDSFGLVGEFNECGSLYRQTPPDLNMCLPPLAWQTYDIVFNAARFDPETKAKTAPARITVFHNGVAVHDDRAIASKTGAGQPEAPTPNPILFQNHSDPVRFRNVWFVERVDGEPTPTLAELIAASEPPVEEAGDFMVCGCRHCGRQVFGRIAWRWRRGCR
jgi:hypothetical protein